MGWFQEFLNMCHNLLQSFNLFSDTLDILLIAVLVYWLMGFVRNSNTFSVLKGILLLLVMLGLSNLLRLSVVSLLLSEVFSLGILVVVVLFQPEIRRILEQAGSTNFTGMFKTQTDREQTENAVAQTVLACIELAKTKTGALIVFERNMSLDPYCKTGTKVDAEPAAELLKNIFFPNTPLHDGAVMIRGGRILCAACMVPLSDNANLSRELGMRHRAGIGISEHTDAVAIIVSEESGAISVAIGGMLKRHLAPDTFEKILRNELLPKEEKKVPFWKRIFNKGGKKNAK